MSSTFPSQSPSAFSPFSREHSVLGAHYLFFALLHPSSTLAGEQQPLLSDYHSINPTQPSLVRVPKKVATTINVEAKVWFANERSQSNSSLIAVASSSKLTFLPSLLFPLARLISFSAWLAYLSISILLGSLSATLYSAGKEGDQITKALAGAYGGM